MFAYMRVHNLLSLYTHTWLYIYIYVITFDQYNANAHFYISMYIQYIHL